MKVDGLAKTDNGVWKISTKDSWYLLDLDAGTVQRFTDSGISIAEGERRDLRTFFHSDVGRRGYWVMHPGQSDLKNSTIWHQTSVVLSIEWADDGDPK